MCWGLVQTMMLFMIHGVFISNMWKCFRRKERSISGRGKHGGQLFLGYKNKIVNNSPENLFSEAVNQFSSRNIENSRTDPLPHSTDFLLCGLFESLFAWWDFPVYKILETTYQREPCHFLLSSTSGSSQK